MGTSCTASEMFIIIFCRFDISELNFQTYVSGQVESIAENKDSLNKKYRGDTLELKISYVHSKKLTL